MDWKKAALRATKGLVYLLYFILLIWCLNDGKYIGFIVLVLLMGLWRLWNMRDQYMAILQYVESAIWGKPLQKDLWEKGEFARRKVRIRWKKKKHQKKS